MSSTTPATAAVLEAVEALGPPGTPVTAPEVAEKFGCTRRTVYNRLDALTDDGVLATKKVGANGRVWWRPVDRERGSRTVLNSMDEGYLLADVVFNDDGEPLDVFYRDSNPAAVEMAGEELEGRWLTEVDVGDEEHWYELFGRVADTGEGERHELYAEAGDSWYNFYVFKPEAAGPRRIAIVFEDISERKRAERDLRESEARLDAFVTATSDVVYRMSPDWSEMYELDGEEFVIDTTVSRETGLEEYIPPDEHGRVTAATEEAVETTSTLDLEHQVMRADGTQGWVHARAVPVFDDDGELVEWFGASSDITQRKRLERDLREETERLDVAVENSPLVLFQQDTDLRYTWYKSLHESFEDVDVLGKRDKELLSPEAAEAVRAPKRRALATGERVREEVTYDLAEGTKTYDLTVDPIRDESGAVAGVTCAAIDITERTEAERRLEESQERLEAELEATRRVHEVSTQVITERDGDVLYESVLDTAVDLLDADFGTIQRLDPSTRELDVVAHRGFSAETTAQRDRVTVETSGSCQKAIQTEERVVVPDVETWEFVDEGEALDAFERIGIRSMQSTPLISRSGELLGVMSTQWTDPHEPSERDRYVIDVLGRQVADLILQRTSFEELEETASALKRLNDTSQELIDAEVATVRDRVAPLTRAALDVEYAALWRYDGQSGDLEEHVVDAAANIDADAVTFPAEISNRVWEAFVRTDVDVATDPGGPADAASPLRSRAFVPLGRHGVVCLGSTREGAFDEQTVDLAETVATTVETAWDRAESEDALAQRNEELTRLDRLNTLIRRIDGALVAADTREEIAEAVCERLAESNLYEFAWVGDHDPVTNTVEPRAWGGVDGGYLADLSVPIDDDSVEPNPVGQAVRTGEPQVITDVATDCRVADWRAATLERDAQSLVCIPLVYDDATYGVLAVYADRPGAAGRDHEVLSELGATVVHTIDARETRTALQTDSAVELTLRAPNPEAPLCRLARKAGCTVDYQGFVRRSDGDADVFFMTREDATATLSAAAEDSVVFRDLTCLAERSEGALFGARVTDPTLAARVADNNGVVRSMTVDADGATVVLDLPRAAVVREFLDRLREWAPGLELRGRRPHERPLRTRQTFAATLEDRLTDRQREVLQTAYLSGYFETPRASTGQEVADLVGVSPPTFSEHLRAGERAVCATLFDDA